MWENFYGFGAGFALSSLIDRGGLGLWCGGFVELWEGVCVGECGDDLGSGL